MNKTYTILCNEDISKDNKQVRIALYANIGFLIEVVQMLEFNLRKILCYEKSINEIETGEITEKRVNEIHEKYDKYYEKTYSDKLTLGMLKTELEKMNVFDKQVINEFYEINQFRIKIVHIIFQNNVNSNFFEKSDNVLNYLSNRLIPMINKTDELNKQIINMIIEKRNIFRNYLKR